jgi:hypothetical protein
MKRVLMIMLIGIFLIGTVSAFNFDNVKRLNGIGRAAYPNVEIKNLFGIGGMLWRGELTNNTDVCRDICYSEMVIELGAAGSIVDDVKMYKIQNDGMWERNIRRYQFYYKNGNSWVPFDLGDEFDAGVYHVRLEGHKKRSWSVDWVIETQGQVISEWAVWGSPGATLYEYHNTGDGADTSVGSPSSDAQRAMTFTIGTTGTDEAFTIGNATVKIFRVGDADKIGYSIRAVNATGQPTGAVLTGGFLDIIDAGITTNTAGAWYNLSFTDVYELQASTQYALVLNVTSGILGG